MVRSPRVTPRSYPILLLLDNVEDDDDNDRRVSRYRNERYRSPRAFAKRDFPKREIERIDTRGRVRKLRREIRSRNLLRYFGCSNGEMVSISRYVFPVKREGKKRSQSRAEFPEVGGLKGSEQLAPGNSGGSSGVAGRGCFRAQPRGFEMFPVNRVRGRPVRCTGPITDTRVSIISYSRQRAFGRG